MKLTLIFIIIFNFGLLSQNRILFYDIDDSDFPRIRGKFYVSDSLGNRLNNIDINDIKIFENEIERNIERIYCPPDLKEPIPMSSVLIIDVSGSMKGENLEITKEVGKRWIDLMQSTDSECGITSFNSSTKYILDLTKNYPLLHQKIDGLIADGGTDYDFALSLQYSGLEMVSGGQYIKNIVMITDGKDTLNEYKKVIEYAQQNSIIVNVVALRMEIPFELKELTKATGGLSISNIEDYDSFLNSILEILNLIQSFEPCEIEWISDLKCKTSPTKIDFVFQEQDTITEFHPTLSENIASALIEPSSISFIDKELNITHDTTFTITATRGEYAISEINSSHSFYNISPQNIIIPEGETREFTISYTPNDSIYSYNFINIINDRCELRYLSAGGYKDKLPENESRLKLTHPDGGEIFTVGSDTIITWVNVLPDDTVRLEYSYDEGKTWNLITNFASNLEYKWKNIPYPTSDECLVRVSQYEKEFEKINYDSIPYKIFEKNFGGSKIDILKSVKLLKDSSLIIIGDSESDDFDVLKNNGGKDIVLFKLNKKNNIEWSKNFGGLNHDNAIDIIEETDGYLIFANSISVDGDFLSNSGGSDIWILKINFLGELLWMKNIKGSGNDYVYDVVKKDNNFYLTGSTNSNDFDFEGKNIANRDIFVAKLDENCDIIWLETFGGNNSDIGIDIKVDSNNNIIVASETNSTNGDIENSNGDLDIFILFIEDNGNLRFSYNFGGSKTDIVSEIIETQAGDYIFIGGTNSEDKDISIYYGNGDVWIVKFDILGNIIWEKTFGGGLFERGICINENKFGEYIFGSFTSSFDGNVLENNGSHDYWFVKIDNIGQLIWERTYGGSMVDELKGFVKLYDGSYILSGSTDSEDKDINKNNGLFDFWIVNVSPDPPTLQNDISNNLFSIVSTEIEAIDVDMGEVVVGTFKDSLISDFIKNIGLFETEIKEVNFKDGDNSEFSLVSNFPPFNLDANSNTEAEFRFSPASVGPKQSTIEIITQSDTFTYNITGVGVDANLELVTELLDFGWVELGDEKIVENTVMIKNISNEVIEILDSKLEYPNEESFRIINGGGSFILDPNDEREMTIAFKPVYNGSITSNIKYYYDGAGSPMISTLLGSGIKGKIIPQIEDGYTNEVKNLELKFKDISLENLTDIIESYKINISYNGTMLAPVDRLIPKKFISQDRIELEIEGKITEITGDILKTIPMKVGLGNDTITEFRIEKMTLYDKEGDEFFYEFETEIDEFKLLGYCQEGGVRLINPENEAFMEITPNPVESILNLNINFIEIGYTKIELYSSTGKLLDTIFEKDVEELTYKNIMLDMSKYKSGMYLLKFQSPTILITKKISVIR